jgi:hypothetical protein
MYNNAFGIVFPPQGLAPIFASFSSTETQRLISNEALPFTYTTDDIQPVGVKRSGASLIPSQDGIYKCLTSLQCDKNTGGGTGDLNMYLTLNGTAIPNTATKTAINQNQEVVMAVEWFVALKKDDELQVVGFSPDEGLEALAVAEASPVPAIPSIITTLLRIGPIPPPLPVPAPAPPPAPGTP